jgi:hypothetical protein
MRDMPSIDWWGSACMLTICAMTEPTMGRLFELLIGPIVRGESEIAQQLGIDGLVLRARLDDLKKRGILAGPHQDGPRTTWTSQFSSVGATIQASERSGLRASSAVPLRRAWWNAMWATK